MLLVCYLYAFVGDDVTCMSLIELMWCFCSVIASSMKEGHITPLGVCMFYTKRHLCQNKASAIFIIFIEVPGSFTIDFSGLRHTASVFWFRFMFYWIFCFFLETWCHQLPDQRAGPRLPITIRRSCGHNCLAFVNITCTERETFYGCRVVAQICRRLNWNGQRDKHRTPRGL